MSKHKDLKNSGRVFVLSMMGMLFLAGAVKSSAQALQCGAVITANITLMADLKNCPADGIDIGETPGPIMLNLNGHTINGSGAGTGISVGPVRGGVTIKGPGKIVNFAGGIAAGGGFGDVLIYDLIITGNQFGIGIGGRTPGTVRVLDNIINGGKQGQVGISVVEGSAYIYKNTISGYATAFTMPFESSAEVDENLITLNQTGIYLPVSNFGIPGYCIRGNTITLNSGTGIQFGSTGGDVALLRPEVSSNALSVPSLCFSIEDNTVTFNGGNGIAVSNDVSTRIQDNFVSFNRTSGINLAGDGSTPVIGNRVQNNGTDIFWDGNGAPCGQQNIFNSSSSATLPSCD